MTDDELLLELTDWADCTLQLVGDETGGITFRVYRPGASTSRYAVYITPEQERQLHSTLSEHLWSVRHGR